ncbi:LysR family transcriptional regulator [Robbsia andropogonis]|uniref:LysR family transcriptional regulator n=1 Tax=Robbsia andropogonis TaxID=28092 RepID=UPI00046351BF|nr:LysR family transcriptional regulator [Robbsia andropogonis]MCP1118551.1 LysR family transcriptional regulator [Robbsia andropogonis]MCP1128018.1 LysR family transcriptional regulator [Robbsia andropogonis]
MDRFQAMQVFTRVVEMSSFSRAADALNIPHASATTLIKKLEAHLNVRLLQRTTRKLNLTPEGAQYYAHCVRILADIEDGEHAVSQSTQGPRGVLRLDMPGAIGRRLIMPRLPAFRERYPDIELMIGFSDRPVDLIQDGVDCAIRVGELADSTLVARKLGSLDMLTAASPDYLALYGRPQSLAALAQHRAVRYFSHRTGRMLDLVFEDGARLHEIKMRSTLSFNDAEACILAAVEGAGLVQSTRFLLAPYLRCGALTEVLTHLPPPSQPISVVYPQNRHLASKVRVFVDWIAEVFANCTEQDCERQTQAHIEQQALYA